MVQHITTEAQFDALEHDWQRLHLECDDAGLFNSWHWNRLWWQFYGDKGKLCIIVVSIDNVVQGIAPLYRCKTKALRFHTVDTLRFIGTGGDTSPDDLGVLFDNAFKEIVIATICHQLFNHTHCVRLQLHDLIEDAALAATLQRAAVDNGWCTPLQRIEQRTVDSLPESIAAFEQRLSRNARKQRKRRRQQLHKAGQIQFELCATPADVDDAFAHLLRLHKMRHESKGGSDSFQSERYCNFHLAAMQQALHKQELRLLKLVVDGKTIGIEYAFLSKRVLYFFQTGFDPEYQHLSPGHILMMHTIDQAIDDGANRLDLLKGDYEYKKTYAKQTRTTVAFDLWKSPVIYHLLRLVRTVKQWRTTLRT